MEYQKLLEIADTKNAELQNGFNVRRKGGQNGRAGSGPDIAAIVAFKARKEREQRERLKRAQFEKDRLLSLRAQNSKSLKASKMMQIRTKDNDFSKIVMTDDQMEEQKRVDEKIQRKGIIGTKERMKARIKMDEKLAGLRGKEREKAIQSMERDEPVKVTVAKPKLADIINRSKEKVNSNKQAINNNGSSPAKVPNKPVVKKQQPRPPTLSYDQLLNLASEKAKIKPTLQQEIENEMSSNNRKASRPMTQREKDALREERYYKSRTKDVKLPDKESASSQPPVNRKDPKQASLDESPRFSSNSKRKEDTERSRLPPLPAAKAASEPNRAARPASSAVASRVDEYVPSSRTKPALSQPKPNAGRPGEPARPSIASTYNKSGSARPQGTTGGGGGLSHKSQPDVRARPSLSQSSTMMSSKPSAQPSRPPSYNHPRAQMPPPPPPARMLPRPNLPPIGATYRRGIYDNYDVSKYMDQDEDEYRDTDYDEEEDDDMADFIDDGPDEEPPEEEYSRAIREIFGYDKRKYRNIVDDDDDIEEASFSQCMKEEVLSLRAGIKEDLEDIRREEEEKKEKMLRKKAKLKGH